MNTMRQYNERPSTIPNIGADIFGAHRHHHDTYETPEELRQKAQKKKAAQATKELLAQYKTVLYE